MDQFVTFRKRVYTQNDTRDTKVHCDPSGKREDQGLFEVKSFESIALLQCNAWT